MTRAVNLKLLGLVIVVVVAVAAGLVVYNPYSQKAPALTVFSADAYVAESSFLASTFANSTGALYLSPKSAGSFSLAQQIKGGAPVDVFISASKSALTAAYLGNRTPGWGVAFAGDQMVVAYQNQSIGPSMHDVINAQRAALMSNSSSQWLQFFARLSSGEVKVGIADPNSDPAGLRGWLVLRAAGLTYASGNSSYFMSSMIQNHGNVTGANAAALVAPLESGNIDFLFIYRSAAISHRLAFLVLPRLVNLGDPTMGSYYSKVSYTLRSGVQKGAPILLLVTVPLNSTSPAEAVNFVVFVVKNASPISKFGVTVLSPPLLFNSTAVPPALAALISGGSLKRGGGL